MGKLLNNFLSNLKIILQKKATVIMLLFRIYFIYRWFFWKGVKKHARTHTPLALYWLSEMSGEVLYGDLLLDVRLSQPIAFALHVSQLVTDALQLPHLAPQRLLLLLVVLDLRLKSLAPFALDLQVRWLRRSACTAGKDDGLLTTWKLLENSQISLWEPVPLDGVRE